MSLFLSCIFYFVAQIRKTCYRKKRLNLWSLFILIATDWNIENGSCQILCLALEFFVRENLGCFFLQHNNLLKVRKTTDLTKVRKNERVGSILTCPKSKSNYQFSSAGSQENDHFENLYISSHGKTRNIKFGSASGGSDIITS